MLSALWGHIGWMGKAEEMKNHECACEFCPIYHEATIETAEFHNWIVKDNPKIWAKLVNDYLSYQLLSGKKKLGVKNV